MLFLRITKICFVLSVLTSDFIADASIEKYFDPKNSSARRYQNHMVKKYAPAPPIDKEDFKKVKRKGYIDNEVLYLGYSKNPFGPSVMWDENNMSLNEDYFYNNTEMSVPIKEKREKRGVTHLYNIISCATGCNPLSYKGYGCYCGFMGSGKILDSIDRCCRRHDICYSSVQCPGFLLYVIPYLWKCWRGKPLCAIDHLGYGGPYSCAARLCECDRELAMCLSRSPCPTKRALCTSSPLRLLQNLFLL